MSTPWNPGDGRVTQEGASSSNATVAGVPFVPVYAPPVGHGLTHQQQFPPPIPTPNYLQYDAYGMFYKPNYPQLPPDPPPPSIYYSRHPQPNFQYGHYGRPQNHQPVPIVTYAGTTRSHLPLHYNAGEVYTAAFGEEATRDHFTKQVMMLLLLQFGIATGLSAVALEHDRVREDIVDENVWLIWFSMAVGLAVIVYSKIRMGPARKWPGEVYLFALWSLGLIVTLTWLTALLEFQFLLVMQILLTVQIGTLTIVSGLRKTPFLTARSMLIAGAVLVVVAITLASLYTHDVAAVFFGIFTSTIVLVYFLFRLHYLMGDEWRNLQPGEVLTAAMSIFF